MRKTLVLLTFALCAGTAQAQIKCWNDANGKRVCGDAPPPGAKVTTLRNPAAGPAAAPSPSAAAASKDGKPAANKGPLTPAEQEQEYRKRQQEAQKAAAKAEEERKEAAAKKENCQRATEAVRTLESGQRISRVNAKGERVFLEDAEIQQELGKARELQRQHCSG